MMLVFIIVLHESQAPQLIASLDMNLLPERRQFKIEHHR